MTDKTVERARRAQIVPVLTIEDADHAVPLARALIAGGLDVLEVTLRTPAALNAIGEIRRAGLDCAIGAGTILSCKDVEAASKAGAEFLVSPGTPASLVPALQAFDGLVFPGAATATEAMTLNGHGFHHLKFFPAEAAGGARFLKSLAGPLPGLTFMPTGGVTPENMAGYLALPNVLAVGSSWLTPPEDISAGRWDTIRDRAKNANQGN